MSQLRYARIETRRNRYMAVWQMQDEVCWRSLETFSDGEAQKKSLRSKTANRGAYESAFHRQSDQARTPKLALNVF